MIAGAEKSLFVNGWYATVDGKAKCDHIHRTSKAAVKCANKWIRFQQRVDEFRKRREMLMPISWDAGNNGRAVDP